MSESNSQVTEGVEQSLGHIDALPVGTLLGEFELQGLIGVGGFGMVYKGYDHSLQRPVAIKEYMPSALVGRAQNLQLAVKSTADAQTFQAGLTSFMAEARLLARFDHPSLVKVYRFWEANNTAYMAMPLYQGITLKQARSLMGAPPPEAWLRSVLWSVAEALKVLHANNTIHRDVSPDNIFLQDIGPPVLLDLGAARRAVLDRDHKNTAILKVNYAPIEQYADAKDLQEGPWTDLYALGAVVHGCVCNEAPLPATIRAVRDRMPSFLRVTQTAQTHFGVGYSRTFVDAIAHALVIEPDHRTQSVMDFCEEIQLQAPEDFARFNWRLALGNTVILEDDTPDLLSPLADTQLIEKTLAQPRLREVGRFRRLSAVKKRRRSPAIPPQGTDSGAAPVLVGRPHYVLLWVLLFLFCASVALALAAWLRPGNVDTSTHAEITEPAVAAAPVSVVSDEPAGDKDAALAPAQPPLLEVPPGPNADAPATDVPSQVAEAAPANKTVKKPTKTPAKPHPREKPVVQSASSPATQERPTAIEAAVVPVAAPEPAVTPAELCASAGFFGRSMCIYRYCQKPEFANLPLCIEDRKQWERRNKTP